MSKHSAKNAVPEEEKQQAKQPEANAKPAEEKPEPDENAEKEKTPDEIITELAVKFAEANDNYLRKAADFENFRKRMNREKQEAIEYANQSLLLDLIEIVDDFERALKSAETLATGEFKAFYEGITMIEKRFTTLLENKWGLKRFNSQGEPFDPNLHEAILMEKSAEITEPLVQEEYNKGYTLKERVVRHAKVKVLMPEKNAAQNNEEANPPEKTG